MKDTTEYDDRKEVVAEQLYKELARVKTNLKTNVREELRKHMDGELEEGEERMHPAEIMGMIGQAGLVMEELERQQRSVIRFKMA